MKVKKMNDKFIQIIKENRSCYNVIIKRDYREIYDNISNLDGDTFSEKLYFYLYGIGEVCKECGSKTSFIGINDGYREYCSRKCVNKSADVKERIKLGYIKKYGVDNVSKSPLIKEKKKNTYFNRYGVSSPFGIEGVKEKCIEKTYEYINENRALILARLKDDRRAAFISQCENGERLGSKIEALFDSSSFTNIKDNNLRFRCKVCNTIFQHHLQWGVIPRCWRCYPNSEFQDEVISFVQKSGFAVFPNVRNVIYGELDLYIPSMNLAVECNGEYWHSCVRKEQYYHLDKTIQCEDKNIKLVHIFENEWKKDSTREILSSILYDKVKFDNDIEVDRRFFNKVFFKDTKEFNFLGESVPQKKIFGGHECWDCGTLKYSRLNKHIYSIA